MTRPVSKFIQERIERNKKRELELTKIKEEVESLLVLPALDRNWYNTRVKINYGLYIPVIGVTASSNKIFELLFYDDGNIGLSPSRKYLIKEINKLDKYDSFSGAYRTKDIEEIYEVIKNVFI